MDLLSEFLFELALVAGGTLVAAVVLFAIVYFGVAMDFLRGRKGRFVLGLAVIGIAVTVIAVRYQTIIPDAYPVCDKPPRGLPVRVSCRNLGEFYSSIRWTFEDGTVIEDRRQIERVFDDPGTYTVTVTSRGPGIGRFKTRSATTEIVVDGR